MKKFTHIRQSEVQPVGITADGVKVFKIGEHLIAVASIPFLAILGNKEALHKKLEVVGRLFGMGIHQIHIEEIKTSGHLSKTSQPKAK